MIDELGGAVGGVADAGREAVGVTGGAEDLFRELALFFTRQEPARLIDRLLRPSRDDRGRYELTDYHWLGAGG